MEQKIYPDRILDKDFAKLVQSKINEIQNKYKHDVLSLINTNDLKLRAEVMDGKKPKSKFRKHKRQILHYLDYHIIGNSENMDAKTFLDLRETYLAQTNAYMEDLGFRQKGLWIIFSAIGLLIDLILIYTDFADLYYNIPVVFLYCLISGIYKDYKAKKANKLLTIRSKWKNYCQQYL